MTMTLHVLVVLFAWVLLNQAGVPIPVVPSLLAAGALAAHTGGGMVPPVVVTVVATLTADLVWYSLGRWRGPQVFSLVRRLSRRSARRVGHAVDRFSANAFAFLFTSRFLPELNPIAAGMAGATRMSLERYLLIAISSAVAWALLWTGAGFVVGSVARPMASSFDVTITLVVVAAAIVAVWAAVKHPRRITIVVLLLLVVLAAG
jgi:membrane protein DedA with SNARE-associated domain